MLLSYKEKIAKAEKDFEAEYTELRHIDITQWMYMREKYKLTMLIGEIEWLKELITDRVDADGAFSFVNEFFGEKVMVSGQGYVKEDDDDVF